MIAARPPRGHHQQRWQQCRAQPEPRHERRECLSRSDSPRRRAGAAVEGTMRVSGCGRLPQVEMSSELARRMRRPHSPAPTAQGRLGCPTGSSQAHGSRDRSIPSSAGEGWLTSDGQLRLSLSSADVMRVVNCLANHSDVEPSLPPTGGCGASPPVPTSFHTRTTSDRAFDRDPRRSWPSPSSPSVARPDDQDRACCMSDALVADGAEDHAREAAEPT